MNNEFYINKIESYLNNIYIDIEGQNNELDKFINNKSNWENINHIINYHKDEYFYDLYMFKVFCRALRDKIDNG